METIHAYTMEEVPSRFIHSTLGRSLGVFGADAQKLGLYLLANPYLTLEGHYALPLKAITQQTAIRPQRVKKLLQTLRYIGFCRYDFEREWVSVPLVSDIYATGLPAGSLSNLSETGFKSMTAKEVTLCPAYVL